MSITNIKYTLSLLLLVLIVTSCTKVIDLKLGNNTSELVIEGNITNVKGLQVVKLSQNVPFTNTNTYPAVTGATVSVSDDQGFSYPFTEGPAGIYSTDNLAGKSGSVYTMSVISNGKNYTASSTMPHRVRLDSISATNLDFNNGKDRKIITVHFQDPQFIVNQYRFVMYVNQVQVKRIFAINDDFSNGRYVHLDLRENDIDIYPGDIVNVEMESIDEPMYTYWFTLAQQEGDNPGGGVTPSNPPTNITPVTLGYFSAHTTESISLVVR
jgi:hypothetical protein